MTRFRYYLPPRSRKPIYSGICAAVLCLNQIYVLFAMPGYAQYLDYWATAAAALLLSIFDFTVVRRRFEWILFPMGILMLIACLTPNMVHWMEALLFFLLLVQFLVRMPRIMQKLIQFLAVAAVVVGMAVVLIPMLQRLNDLVQNDRATSAYVIPYVLRTVTGEPFCLLAMQLLVCAMKPQVMPGWMDEEDRYDRIWE